MIELSGADQGAQGQQALPGQPGGGHAQGEGGPALSSGLEGYQVQVDEDIDYQLATTFGLTGRSKLSMEVRRTI